jgi:hypothetical protein
MNKFKINKDDLEKNICPTCGKWFEVSDINHDLVKCENEMCPEGKIILDRLITNEDDYLWCI